MADLSAKLEAVVALGSSGARVAAAAFVLGLSLAGPGAVGVAAADSSTDGKSVSSDSAAERTARTARTAPGPRRTGAVARDAAPAATSKAPRAAVQRVNSQPADPAPSAASASPAPAAGASTGSGTPAQSPAPVAPTPQLPPALASVFANGPLPAARRLVAAAVPVATVAGAQAPVAAVARVSGWAAGNPVAPPALAEAVATFRDRVDTNQTSFLNRLANLLIDLPSNNVTTYLEGALALVRQRLFNKAPQISPSTPYVAEDGYIRGRVGAVDAEGDELTFRVVENPKFGTVELDADGSYAYTPGPTYTGSDAFAVEVAQSTRALDLGTPLDANASSIVVIEVGASAPTGPLKASAGKSQVDHPDVTVYLPDAAGHITIRKAALGNRFTGTVTLTDATADTALTWLESTGDRGEFSLGEAMELWPAFQAKAEASGGGVDLGVAYTADDGSDSTLLLSDVSMSTNADGQYVFVGQLSRVQAEDPDSIDSWDAIGKEFKSSYENFRASLGIGNGVIGKFTTVDIDFSHASVFADTTSAISYLQSGLYAFDHQQPVAPGGAITSAASNTATASTLSRYGAVGDVTDGLPASAFTAVTNASLTNANLSPTGEEVDKAFDGSTSTKYLSYSGAGSGVVVDLGDPGSTGRWVVTGLGLTTANDYDSRDPISYRIEGSADGTNFTKVAEGTLAPPAGRTTDYPGVTFANAKDYRYYRLVFPAVRTPSNGGGYLQVSEIRLPGHTLPEIARSPVTASIPLEQSFVIGRKDGSVELWTDGRKQLLQTPGGYGQDQYGGVVGVSSILAYDRPLQDVKGKTIASSFTGSIEGSTLTVTALGAGGRVVVGQQITGAGVAKGTTITKFIVPEDGSCAEQGGDGACTKAAAGKGGVNGGLGTYEVSVAQTLASTEITHPSVPATAPGFIVGLSNGAVQQWSATAGWTELHDGTWGSAITAMTAFQEGVVIGLDDGSVQKWDGPGTAVDPANWKNNWRQLQGPQAYDSVVNRDTGVIAIVAHKGSTPQDDGIVVATGEPASKAGTVAQVQFWDPVRGWTELSSAANEWDTGNPYVTAMTAYRAGGKSMDERYTVDGVAVGFSDGSVRYWDGTVGHHAGWEELQGKGWRYEVSTLVPYTSPRGVNMLAAGLSGSGGVKVYSGYPPTVVAGGWTELHDAGWGAGVQSLVTYSSSTVGSGLIAGLNNGSMQLWSGKFPTFNQTGNADWTELHDAGWGAGAVTVIPFEQNLPDKQGNVSPRDGIVVGLGNGSVQQWSGLISGNTGQADWTQVVCGPAGCVAPAPNPAPLSVDGTLKDAVTFAKGVVTAGNPDWGKAGSVGSIGDPLFDNQYLLPPCEKSKSCDGQYVPIATYIQKTPVTKNLSVPKTELSVDLKYDVNGIIYGYAFMPNGTWAKLKPGNWSMAALAAVETGPSLTVNIGTDGKAIDIPRTNLFKYQYATPGPLGFDTVALGLGVDGSLSAKVLCGDDGSASCPSKLNAHFYLVPGMLLSYNTQNKPGGISLGYNWYPELDYEDFKQVSGAVVSTTLTPYATIDYGIFAPDDWWFIGGWSLFKLGLGYENPLTATVTVQKADGVTLDLGSQGFLTTHAGILESVTSQLTWDNTIPIYDVSTTYKL